MKIHKEGWKTITYTTILLILLNLILYKVTNKCWLFYLSLIFSSGIFALIINFFRFSSRQFPDGKAGTIVAPADGTIVVVEEVFENDYFHEKRIQVSIFMSLFNAHVNWVPCKGKVTHSSHQKGRFVAAYLPKSSSENERSNIIIEQDNGEQILVRQIAGAMAKRIVTYGQTGQECHINQQLGFIKFGSRVDLFLPLNSEIKVQLDEKVKGNQTILAQLK